jgi:hypothetical protein
VATPETEVGIRIFVTDQDLPYLSLCIGEFGAFYPNIENNNEHFYFSYLNQVLLIKDFSSMNIPSSCKSPSSSYFLKEWTTKSTHIHPLLIPSPMMNKHLQNISATSPLSL